MQFQRITTTQQLLQYHLVLVPTVHITAGFFNMVKLPFTRRRDQTVRGERLEFIKAPAQFRMSRCDGSFQYNRYVVIGYQQQYWLMIGYKEFIHRRSINSASDAHQKKEGQGTDEARKTYYLLFKC